MLPNFGYRRQIMHTDVKKQGLPHRSANRPSIWFTGIGPDLGGRFFFSAFDDTTRPFRFNGEDDKPLASTALGATFQ